MPVVRIETATLEKAVRQLTGLQQAEEPSIRCQLLGMRKIFIALECADDDICQLAVRAQISGKILKIDLDGRRVRALDCLCVLLYLTDRYTSVTTPPIAPTTCAKLLSTPDHSTSDMVPPNGSSRRRYNSSRLPTSRGGRLGCWSRHGSPRDPLTNPSGHSSEEHPAIKKMPGAVPLKASARL
jgi:hypothetical protein